MARLILTNALLIPGDAPPRPATTILVEGERIAAVMRDADAPAPEPQDRVVDLGGRAVMPGMVSCHHHAGYHRIGAMPLPVGFEAPPAYLALAGGRSMRKLIEAGYTGAVGAGNGFAMDASLKLAIQDGLIPGPRLMPCGRGLSTTGFSLDFQQPWFWKGPTIDVRCCDGADEFRKGVREEIKEGAEIIKLYSTGGHLSVTPGTQMEMTREELDACIQAAHAHGAKIRAHVSNPQAVIETIEAGIDVVDHADFLDEAGIDAFLKSGVFFVPSLRLAIESLRNGFAQGTPGEMEAEMEHMRRMVPLANAAGVRMVLGDDYGVTIMDHGQQAEEPAFYAKEIGIPPLDVIRWATKNGAELMGRGHELGTIEAGKLADLLVVDGNPLDDMGLLTDNANLLAIVKGGAFFKDELATLAPAAPGRVRVSEVA
jgi:imidazolonepropionase-like amidohydrolase